jgi:hypothetical protein
VPAPRLGPFHSICASEHGAPVCVYRSGARDLAIGLASSGGSLHALVSLDLSSCGVAIGDACGCTALAETFSRTAFPALRALNLSENSLHDGEPAALLASLAALTTLTWLDLSCNRLRDDAAAPLVGTLAKLTRLHTLGINDNPRLGDQFVATVLSCAQAMPALACVHACSTGAAASATAAALALLGQRAISVKGGLHPEPPSMRVLDLRGNSIDPAVCAQLEAAGAIATDEAAGARSTSTKALDARKMWIEWSEDTVFVEGHGEGAERDQAPVVVG